MTPRIAPVAGVRSDCARLRPALLESAEGGGGAALRPRDRAHLDACARCRHEVTDLALMAIAVRRSLAAAREAEPSAEAWPALRARLLRQRGARTLGRIASPVLAALMAAGLAVAMLVP